jgi:hypothetical protein
MGAVQADSLQIDFWGLSIAANGPFAITVGTIFASIVVVALILRWSRSKDRRP